MSGTRGRVAYGGLLLAFCATLLLAACAPGAGTLEAQARVREPATMVPEARLEFFGARLAALHAGGGMGVRPARAVVVAGIASASVAGADGATDVRLELVGRFHLDPEGRAPVSLYAAGGAAALHAAGGDWRGVLVTLVGAELGRGAWAPFVEAGFGGGARLALGIRRR